MTEELVCKGSLALKSGCGKCRRCQQEAAMMRLGFRAAIRDLAGYIDRLLSEAYRDQSRAQEAYDRSAGKAVEDRIGFLQEVEASLRGLEENPGYFGTRHVFDSVLATKAA